MRMQKYAIILLVFSSTTFAAPPDATIQFQIVGGVTSGSATYNLLEIEVSILSKYVSANGGLTSSETGLTVPVTGTCFGTSTGGVFCNLQVDQESYSITLDSNFNGNMVQKNSFGTITNSAPVTKTAIF